MTGPCGGRGSPPRAARRTRPRSCRRSSWLRASRGLMMRPAAKAPTSRVTRIWPRSGSTFTSAKTAPCEYIAQASASPGRGAPWPRAFELGAGRRGRECRHSFRCGSRRRGGSSRPSRASTPALPAPNSGELGSAVASSASLRDRVGAGIVERAARRGGVARAAGDAAVGQVRDAGAELDLSMIEPERRRPRSGQARSRRPGPCRRAAVSTSAGAVGAQHGARLGLEHRRREERGAHAPADEEAGLVAHLPRLRAAGPAQPKRSAPSA